MNEIKGHKGGGGGGHTPVESPDSIQSMAIAKILLALGEGEWAGGLDGTNIYLDGTPLTNEDGSSNFEGVSWEFRPGTQSQEYIKGVPAVENEITIGTELKSSAPWVRAVNNTQLSAVRLRFGWPALQQQKDNGDVNGYKIEYAIDVATDGGAYREVLKSAVDGKTTTLYERSHRIDLPTATTGWQLRVRRLTANANSGRIADTMNVEAYTEVIDAKLRYPNTALLYVEFNAKQFQNIPKVTCRPKMMIVRVPDNYDSVTRQYSGVWTGGFKWAWTDNPAWVFYDILISERYGLGQRIDSTQVDESELYRIAQYCDQLVPDGRGGGGMEPRFKCDVYIQSREDAWTVLTDFAAIFRGMTCYGQNQIVTLADMPRDLDYTYTRANVINGKFACSSSSERTRYTTAMVGWSDPANHYADAVESVFENALVRRYGVNQTEITAIGCTRQSEANRRGRWALLSNSQDRTVEFSVGLDGLIPFPGHIIGVADQMLSGRVMGGRISSAEGRNVRLDREPDINSGDRLIVNLPSGISQARTVQSVNGRLVTVTTSYSETPQAESVWAVDADELAVQLYRVVSVADNNDNTYTIVGAYHDPDKYARIDTGARIDERPTSVIPPGVQVAPENVLITSYSSINQGIAVTTLRATWNAVKNAIAYEAEWRKDNGNWVSVPRTSALGFEVPNIYAGRYLVRVRAINASDISSLWATSLETQLNGKEGKPPLPIGFKADPLVFGIQLSWNFPDGAEDTLKTEIQYNTAPTEEGVMLLSDIPYPQRSYQQMGLSAGQSFFYRARLVDKSGNQGDWIDWVLGESSTDVEWIADEVKKGIEESDAFKEIDKNLVDSNAQLQSAADAAIQNALANDADVRRWMVQNGERKAEIIETQQLVADETEARATAVTQLKTQTDKTSSDLTEFRETVAKDNEATAQKITQLNSKTDTTNSNITALEKTVADSDKALSEKITGLTSTVGENTAAIQVRGQTIFNKDGTGSSVYSMGAGITYKGKYYAAGLSIGAEVNAAGTVSTRILASADQFAVLNPATNGYTLPFFVQGSQTFIVSALIQDASITNAKIGSYIQSNNYVAGKAGWRIDKNGVLEMNSALPGGGRSVFDSNGMAVYDQNGVKRFAAGYKP
ncbi:MAG: host specificity protein J [Enterobacteriaceae bacterium]|uniref:host specificity protein J n=1 Tax=Hafnia paralvei TaxID=546367 RepID=UPI000EDEDD4C|nr:host specificity protein J [Hafnia paralvei]MDU1193395.1 host specificity protein J [Enterobacteriaceae bacterium]MDU1245490.1 host specificity protein J [Enterobacteriaceae bacterium]HCU14311.1 host specificity protein [Hafnia paralvei]